LSTSTQAVFLSYASQDAEAARRICEALRAAGLVVWFDQNELRGGDAWDDSIRRRIKECALFVPVVSANTEARSEGYFRLEWKLAVDRSHQMADDQAFLLPVVIDDTPDATARVPDRFRERQWSRLPAGENADAFTERVRRLLGTGEANAGAAVGSPLGRPASRTPTAVKSAPAAGSSPGSARWRSCLPCSSHCAVPATNLPWSRQARQRCRRPRSPPCRSPTRIPSRCWRSSI
jgi:hypothetical protein